MKIPPPTQQARHSTGTFLNKQHKKQPGLQQQQELIQWLANHPGRHSGNAEQQARAQALLNACLLVTTLQPAPARQAHNTLAPRNNGTQEVTVAHLNSVAPYTGIVSRSDHQPTFPAVQQQAMLAPNPARHVSLSRNRRAASPAPPASLTPKPIIQTSEEENFTARQIAEIVWHEQNKLLDKLLEEDHFKPDTFTPLSRVNALIYYLLEDESTRVDIIARLLLSASGSYGEKSGETITEEYKWAAIAGYLNHAIFSMPFDEWCFQQARHIKLYENALLHHGNLQNRLTRKLNERSVDGELSPQARMFYQNEMLKKTLPTVMLNLITKEREELREMYVHHPRWRFIHAGAMLLSHSGAEFQTLGLKEIAEVGVTLDTLLRNGAIPQEYIGFFKLPALFHYANELRTTDAKPVLTDAVLQQSLLHHGHDSTRWMKANNPVTQLRELLANWKTRPDLAKEILERVGASPGWLDVYLFNNKKTVIIADGRIVQLPNIEEIFEQQNRKLAASAGDMTRLLLPGAFDSLPSEEQAFIINSQVDRVTALFKAEESIKHIPMHYQASVAIQKSDALVHHISARTTLLQCRMGIEERIYALTVSSFGNYFIERVDRQRKKMLWLLDSSYIPYNDNDYQLRITSHTTLKKWNEGATTLINRLAAQYERKIYAELKERGFNKTPLEKTADLIKSFVPFYTCVTSAMAGNTDEMIPACILDTLSMVPFAGIAARTGFRFGATLSRSAAIALAHGARQATINTMLNRAGTTFVNQFPSIAKEISPRVMRTLGVGFFRSVDPGFELLSAVGERGISALETIVAQMTAKGRGLKRLSQALPVIDIAQPAITHSTSPRIETYFSPQQGRTLDVAIIGSENHKPVWAQVDRETGALSGRKYTLDAQANLQLVPSPLTDQLRHHINLRQLWPENAQASGSQSTGAIAKKRLSKHSPIYEEFPMQLPIPAGNIAYWNFHRHVADVPDIIPAPAVATDKIQELERFIPIPSFTTEPLERINEELTLSINEYYADNRWFAYTAIPQAGVEVPPHIAWLQSEIQTHLKKSVKTFTKARNILIDAGDEGNLMATNVGRYLSGMLNTSRVDVIREAYLRLMEVAIRGEEFLNAAENVNFSNVIVISSELIAAPKSSLKYVSGLDRKILNNIPLAEVCISDPEARIFLYADSFQDYSSEIKKGVFKDNPVKYKISSIINHETTHISANSEDIFLQLTSKDGSALNAEKSRDAFIKHFFEKPQNSLSPAIYFQTGFIKFIEHLLKYQGVTGSVPESAVTKAVFADEMLFANLMMNDADVLANTLKDLVKNRPFDAKSRISRQAPPEPPRGAADVDDVPCPDWIFLSVAQAINGGVNIMTTPLEGHHADWPAASLKLNQQTINGIDIKIQNYGSQDGEALLYPEINSLHLQEPVFNTTQYMLTVPSVSGEEFAALNTWVTFGDEQNLTNRDFPPGITGGMNFALNEKLDKRAPLTSGEQDIYDKTISVIKNKKYPSVHGDYLRECHYFKDGDNPWLEDYIDINDYVTTPSAFMSVHSDSTAAVREIHHLRTGKTPVDSIVIYKIENAANAVSLLPFGPPSPYYDSMLLYPPTTLFKVKSLSIARPVSPDNIPANATLFKASRLAIILSEVEAEEAKKISTAKNLFTGEVIQLNQQA